jgi:predicted outer membrane repeat protein
MQAVKPAALALSTFFILLMSASPSWGTTDRHVPSEYPTIQAAVTASENGDSILIAPGTYSGVGNRGIAPGTKIIYIRGEGGAGSVVIDAEGLDSGFMFTEFVGAHSYVFDVTIRNGDPYGVYAYMTSPVLIGCRIESCESGILFADCDGMLVDSTIDGCRKSGMVVTAGSVCGIQMVKITNNDGQYGAGLEVISSSPSLLDCTISGNDASDDGGGIYAENSTLSLKYVAITGNRAAGVGGGMRLLSGSAVMDTTTVSRNVSGMTGGGLYGENTSATFNKSILWGNCAPDGREILIDAPSTAHFYCSVVDVSGVSGGGSYSYASAIYSDPWFCNMGSCADAPTDGGDFHVANGSPCFGGPCGFVGALTDGCWETPVRDTTWGWIKASFR